MGQGESCSLSRYLSLVLAVKKELLLLVFRMVSRQILLLLLLTPLLPQI